MEKLIKVSEERYQLPGGKLIAWTTGQTQFAGEEPKWRVIWHTAKGFQCSAWIPKAEALALAAKIAETA